MKKEQNLYDDEPEVEETEVEETDAHPPKTKDKNTNTEG